MIAASPLVFKPSSYHRIFSVLLCLGSWMAGIRGLVMLVNYMPRLAACVHQARLLGESTYPIWAWVTVLIFFCLAGGLILVASIIGLMLIESTSITVDEIGITVAYSLLPKKMAIYFGAGHIPWNKVVRLEKQGIFFILYSGQVNISGPNSFSLCRSESVVKFIVVHELERLVLTVLRCSPNITFSQ